MNIINIAIKCEEEHKAAIYTLATSVAVNKNVDSIYNMYFLLNNTEKDNWIGLKELENGSIKVYFEEEFSDLVDKADRVICLKWNTLVMGDLTRLCEIDMEDKCQAMARNFPEIEYSMSNGNGQYSDSVCVIDNKKEYMEECCKELPIFYNLAYDEILNNNENRYKKNASIKSDELSELKEWALIIRYNKEHSPDKFFDSILSELWMKYYRLSPKSNEIIHREAYVETIGKLNVDINNAIPVLISIDDSSVVNVMALVCSLEKNISKEKQLDIRLVYTQLSNRHKDMILSMCSEKVSIVLCNIKAWRYNNKKLGYAMLTSQIFSFYSKAIFVKGNVLCNEKIWELYNQEIGNYWLTLNRDYENEVISYRENILTNSTSKEEKNDKTVVMLVNVEQWIENGVCDIISSMLSNNAYQNYDVVDLINIVCARNTKWVEIGNAWDITEDDTEEYISFIRSNLSQFLREDDIEREMKSNAFGEDAKVQEIIEKIQKLEEANARLVAKNKQLEKENKALDRERKQYLYEIEETRKSFTYRVGRMITFIPRKLRGHR